MDADRQYCWIPGSGMYGLDVDWNAVPLRSECGFYNGYSFASWKMETKPKDG